MIFYQISGSNFNKIGVIVRPVLAHIICYSGIECRDEIYSSHQLACSTVKVKCENTSTGTVSVVTEGAGSADSGFESPESSDSGPRESPVAQAPLPKLYAPALGPPIKRPQTATSRLFAPRTEEMNKGFLMFSEEEPGLTSKFQLFIHYGLIKHTYNIVYTIHIHNTCVYFTSICPLEHKLIVRFF